jgi:hypothetical protein
MTGRSPVGPDAGSFSSPRFRARRHLNNWFAFTPCAHATIFSWKWACFHLRAPSNISEDPLDIRFDCAGACS